MASPKVVCTAASAVCAPSTAALSTPAGSFFAFASSSTFVVTAVSPLPSVLSSVFHAAVHSSFFCGHDLRQLGDLRGQVGRVLDDGGVLAVGQGGLGLRQGLGDGFGLVRGVLRRVGAHGRPRGLGRLVCGLGRDLLGFARHERAEHQHGHCKLQRRLHLQFLLRENDCRHAIEEHTTSATALAGLLAGRRDEVSEPRDGLRTGEDGKRRCSWDGGDPTMVAYHDVEWGRPMTDDHRLFEKLCLEGFQSGLSWRTILHKREHFREAFAGFDVDRVARFTAREVTRLLTNAGIVRHRGKIESTINNAKRACELREEYGSLAAYFWSFEPTRSSRPARIDLPTLMTLSKTPESTALSKDLRKRGWSFVGPTTVYAFMQATGLVNDHIEGCSFRAAVERERRAFRRPAGRR